jgi:glutamate formiminotransferase
VKTYDLKPEMSVFEIAEIVGIDLAIADVRMIARIQRQRRAKAHSAELIGLIPEQALIDAAQWYLQLDNLEPESILEWHLK